MITPLGYVNVSPIVAIILGAAFLTEKLTGVFLVGFVTVVVGVLFVNRPRRIEIALPCRMKVFYYDLYS